MKPVTVFAVLPLLTACAAGPTFFRSGPQPNGVIEAHYTRALSQLDPAYAGGSLDSAVIFLDAYLAYAGPIQHRAEAAALRRLAGSALHLAKVEAALQQARARASETRGAAAKPGDEDSLKEVQRLKDELAAANAELDRIRKRLATQKP